MKKGLSLVLALALLLSTLMIPSAALAQTEREYKHELANENIELGYDAIGKYLVAKFVGFVFDEPSSGANHSAGKTEVGSYYQILDYRFNYGEDAYFRIQFGSKTGWVLGNKVKVTEEQLTWSAWSRWSTRKPSSASNRQIESKKVREKRTVYKYSRFALQYAYTDDYGNRYVYKDYYSYEWYPGDCEIISAKWEYKTSYKPVTGEWYNETVNDTYETITYYRYRTATFR